MRGRVRFDWQVQEHESNDQPSPAAQSVAPASSTRLERWLVWLATLASLLLLAYWGGQQVVNRAEENLAGVEEELTEAVVMETWTAYERRQARLARANSSQPAPTAIAVSVDRQPADLQSAYPRPSNSQPNDLQAVVDGTVIQSYQLDGDLARVQLFVAEPTEPWHSRPYYVTHVFRESPSGWALVAPVSRLWGETRTLETTYFHVEYGHRNSEAVAAVAPDLDALYLRLYRDLGLVPPRQVRMHIRIDVVGGLNFDVTDLRSSGSTLIVPPPELLERPTDVSQIAALRDAIAFPLAVKVFDRAIEQYIIPCNWYSLTQGVGLWQRWDGQRLPSRRHWVAQQELATWLASEPTPTLDDLVSVPQDCWHRPPFFGRDFQVDGSYVPRAELAATFVSFAAEQHSRRIVPELLRALVRHKEWATLVPDVFDLDAAELEAAWQEYVATQQPTRTQD